MGFLREIIGFALLFASWFNPLGLDAYARILMFILGFDMMSLAPKIAIFILDFFVGFAHLGWTLLILVASEIISMFLLVGFFINLIIKPMAVFAVALIVMGTVESALAVAGIDFLLNLTHIFKI